MLERHRQSSHLWIEGPRDERLALSNSHQATANRPSLEVLRVVWRGRWIILACVILSLAIANLYLSRATPIFESSSTLYLQHEVPNALADPISTNAESAGYLYTQCQVIHSTAILSSALKLPEVFEASCLHGVTDAVGFLKGAVSAVPDSQGDLIMVSTESTRPEDAASIVNGVVEAYINYLSDQHKSTAVEVLKILQAEMQKRDAELQGSQQAILNFKKANPNLAIELDKGRSVPSKFTAISDALNQAQMHTLDLTIAVQQANAVSNDPFQLRRIMDHVDALANTVDMDSTVNPDLTQAYQRAREEYLDDAVVMGPRSEALKEALERVELLRNELDAEKQNAASLYMSILNSELDAAQQREGMLKQALDSERQEAIDLNFKEAEYDHLVEQEENTQRALDTLDTRMKTVNVTEDIGHLTASVLETAKPDFAAVKPNRPHTLGMALVIGLMSGLGLSLLREMMEQHLRLPEEISNLLSLPILGAVPNIQVKDGLLARTQLVPLRMRWRRFIPFLGGDRDDAAQIGTMVQRGQEMRLRPYSEVSESYRTIRTAISFGLGDHPARTILITSPVVGDGKTTLTSNLAISVAQAGRRVLLIDADCRTPKQHKIFGLPESPGLSDVLLGKMALSDAVKPTAIEKLDFLACGSRVANTAEMLDSPELLKLLKEAAERYDRVLIDSPPVVTIADARILAAHCEATILVLRSGKSTQRLADAALDALESVGAAVLGAVVNDAPRQHGGRYYRYYSDANGNGNGNGNGHGDSGNSIQPIEVSLTRREPEA